MFFGFILIAVGVIAILIKLGVLSGSMWGYIWPAVLIILGLSFLWGRRRRRSWMWGKPWCFPGEEKEKQ